MILMEILTRDWRVELLRKHGLPFVMIGRCEDNTGLSYVDVDIARGVADAIRHLFELGHRQIGFVTIAPILQRREYGYATWALKGYQQTCQQFGLPSLWQAVDLKSNHVHDVVLEFLGENPEITAIVTPQDAGVPGILRAVRSRGLRIPQDISVVGLLNDSLAEFITPPLDLDQFPLARDGAGSGQHLDCSVGKPPAHGPAGLTPGRSARARQHGAGAGYIFGSVACLLYGGLGCTWVRLPLRQLPDLWLGFTGPHADLGEYDDCLLEMRHRLFGPAGRMQQVRQVVV